MVVFVASVAATRRVVEMLGLTGFVVELGEREFLFVVVLTDWTADETICLSADLAQSRQLVRRW